MIFNGGETNDEKGGSKANDNSEGLRGKRLLSFPLLVQCYFCGKQFKNNEERNKHKKENLPS